MVWTTLHESSSVIHKRLVLLLVLYQAVSAEAGHLIALGLGAVCKLCGEKAYFTILLHQTI